MVLLTYQTQVRARSPGVDPKGLEHVANQGCRGLPSFKLLQRPNLSVAKQLVVKAFSGREPCCSDLQRQLLMPADYQENLHGPQTTTPAAAAG